MTNPGMPTESGGTKETAQREAGQVGHRAADAAKDVAGTAQQEVRQVKDEAVGQAKSLAAAAREEAWSQASTQQSRLAEQSRVVSDDLERLSRGERAESDLVNQAVASLSQRARRLSEDLESKDPEDLLDDVRRFAARRPWTFLAISAGVGMLAGRLTRGLKDAGDDGDRQLHATEGRRSAYGGGVPQQYRAAPPPHQVPDVPPAGGYGAPDVPPAPEYHAPGSQHPQEARGVVDPWERP